MSDDGPPHQHLPATTHAAHVLELNADSTELCPVKGCEDYLAVGTYQLQEELQERVGQLLLYRLQSRPSQLPATQREREVEEEVHPTGCLEANSRDGGQGGAGPVPHLCHTTHVPGIFDLKWRPLGGDGSGAPATLGAALADGSLRLYRLQQVRV